MSTDIEILYHLAVAIGIGLLIGVQRQSAYERVHAEGEGKLFAGIRTFALLGLFGWLAAFASAQLSSPIVFLAMVAPVLVMVIVAYHITSSEVDAGMTTEVAAFVTVAIGALCFWGELLLAAIAGIVTMALLSFKFELHKVSDQITHEDIVSTLKFATISAIILPLLPTTPFGPAPFDVLNAQKIWLMVVFISAISFLGYLLVKVVGARRGIGLSGLLGGLVSSTAVTLTFAQRSHTQHQLAKPYAIGILVSWVMMFGRVLLEVAVVNAALLTKLWLPLGGAAIVGLAAGMLLYQKAFSAETEQAQLVNPFEIMPAIKFAILYAAILLGANTARLYFGNAGIFISSIVSGLADVDAITLSMADLSRAEGAISQTVAAQAILLALISNTVVKGGIVLLTSTNALRRALAPATLLIVLTVAILAFIV